jgi:hypothetical protein
LSGNDIEKSKQCVCNGDARTSKVSGCLMVVMFDSDNSTLVDAFGKVFFLGAGTRRSLDDAEIEAIKDLMLSFPLLPYRFVKRELMAMNKS